jgi:hypothetical protein
MGIVYCPEINGDDMTANNGAGLLNLMTECHKYTDDISLLDSFTSKISLQLKAKGMHVVVHCSKIEIFRANDPW